MIKALRVSAVAGIKETPSIFELSKPRGTVNELSMLRLFKAHNRAAAMAPVEARPSLGVKINRAGNL